MKSVLPSLVKGQRRGAFRRCGLKPQFAKKERGRKDAGAHRPRQCHPCRIGARVEHVFAAQNAAPGDPAGRRHGPHPAKIGMANGSLIPARRWHLLGDNFTYDTSATATSANGKKLGQRQKITGCRGPLVDQSGMMRYHAGKLDCRGCSLTPQRCRRDPALCPQACSRYGARDRRDLQVSRDRRINIKMLFAF